MRAHSRNTNGQWGFSLSKDTKLGFFGEQGNLGFRAEFFNIINRTNFGAPAAVAMFAGTIANNTLPPNQPNSSAGGNIQAPNGANGKLPLGNATQINTTATNPRQIQLTLRVPF